MSDTPDYTALVKLLPTLRSLVDACGEVTLSGEEAAQIRSLGSPAEAGRWRVPPIPFELVRNNPLLEHLSIGWDSARIDATSNRPNSKNQLCETAQIIGRDGRSVIAARKSEGIRQPINVNGQKADFQEIEANRTGPAPARTIRQESELAGPSAQAPSVEDGAFPRRRRSGYQLPRTPRNRTEWRRRQPQGSSGP